MILFKFSTEPGKLEHRMKLPPSADPGFVGPEDIEEVAALPPFMTASTVREHLARGEECFIVRLGGRIVFQSWNAFKDPYVWLLQKRLHLGPRAIYMYNTYTAPEYRHQHLMPSSIVIGKQHCRERGLTHFYTVVDLRAGLSLRPYVRLLGDGRAVFVQYCRCLWMRRYRCQRMSFEEVIERFDDGGARS